MKYVGFLLLMILSSCVGVTEQGDALKAISNKYNHSSIAFDGVEELKGISHNKMEVYFSPARGGSGKYSYKIYYGGEPLPQVTSSDVLNVDFRGLLRFTLTGLQPARDYIVRVDVEDQITKEVTTTHKVAVESTYSNRVVDFYGISSASNLAGTDGLDSLLIRWTHARCIDDMLCDQGHDPTRYEIILLDRTNEGLNPSSFYDTRLTQADGRIVIPVQFSASNNMNEYIVRGLRPKTEYYVLVRSIHRASVNDINNPRLSGEMNNAYRLISTLDNDLAAINFDQDSVIIENLSGENALTALRAKWKSATGVFDHYRLYYGPVSANLSEGHLDSCKSFLGPLDNINTTVLCKKIDHQETESVIAGLATQTDYRLMFVVCQTATCRDGERIIGSILEGSTVITSPTFSGLSVIATANSITEFGSLKLRFNPIDTSVTYIDGFVVGYKDNPANEVTDYLEIGHSPNEHGTTPLFLDFYNPLSATEIIVRGVDYYSGKNYCFKVFPFVYESNGNRTFFENENWKCINNPVYKAPSASEFQGFKIVRTSGTRITLRWDKPMTGVYEGYEIFYKLDSANAEFSYSQAVYELEELPNTTDYRVMVINNSDQIELTIPDIPDGETITFGILSYYHSPDEGTLRSDDNTGIIRCYFEENKNNDCINI